MENENTSPAQQTVSLNPFNHIRSGVGAFVKTNLNPGLVAILISSVVNALMAAAFLYVFARVGFPLMSGAGSGGNQAGLIQFIAVVVVVAILGALILGYFSSVLNRLIITGARGQKESLGLAFSFVFNRLSKIVVTYLLIFAIFIGGVIIISMLGAVSSVLAVVLAIAGLVAAVVFALRIAYVPLVLVDNEDPGKAMAVIKRSAALWNKSGWALVLYVLTWLVIYIILSLFTGDSGTFPMSGGSPDTLFSNPAGLFGAALVGALISSFISNVFGALVYCGEASIYNDARKLTDGKTAA